MSKIIDESLWKQNEIDGHVMAYLLGDPRTIRNELNIKNLNQIDDILTFIKRNRGQYMDI